MDYVDSALRTFFQIHVDKPPGDVLIFLPGRRRLIGNSFVPINEDLHHHWTGQEDIENLEKSIRMYAKRLPIERMEVGRSTIHLSVTQA